MPRLAWGLLAVALGHARSGALRKPPPVLLNHRSDPHGDPHFGTQVAPPEGHAEEHAAHAEDGGHGVHPLDSHGAAAHEVAHEHAHEAMAPGHEPRASACSGAGSVAVGLFATTMLIPWAFSMVMYGGIVSRLMWRFIDFFVSVFLAILWFGAFSDVLNLDYFRQYFSTTLLIIIQVFVLYALAMTVAYFLRDNHFRLLAFAGCGAHYVAFAGIAAGEHTQREYFAEELHEPFVLTAIAFAVFAAVFGIGFRWRSDNLSDKFNHVADEIELDVAGLVTSYLLTQSVRTVLSGRYPAPHLLQTTGHHTPEPWQRWAMLGWALTLVTTCIVTLPRLQYWGREGFHQHRASHFCKVLLIMSSSWAFLLWGEWEFHATFHGDVLFGKMVFALMGTVVCFGIILATARVLHGREHDFRLLEAAEIGVTGLSLVAAWSWEHCFDIALNTIGEDYQVGYGGLVPKLTLAILVPMFVLPVYINYIKPQVVKADEEEEAEEEEVYGHVVGTPVHAH